MAWLVKGKSLFGCGCLPPVFCRSAVLQFAVLRELQPPGAEARRFGCRRARTPQAAFALFRKRTLFNFASVGAVLFSCRSPRGEFCEPPQGGASARPAEAGVYLCKLRPPRTSFLFTSPRCRQLHIPVCRGAGKNSKFKMQNSQLWQACPAGSVLFLIRKTLRPGRLALKARPPQPARARILEEIPYRYGIVGPSF